MFTPTTMALKLLLNDIEQRLGGRTMRSSKFNTLLKSPLAVGGAFFLIMMSAANAKDAKPLFDDDSVIQIQITAPMRELVKNAPDSTDPFPATLTLLGEATEEHAIALSARGNSRRDPSVCKFPPLRVAFDEKPEDASLFDGQKRLKLVTHCRVSRSYQQYYLLEYAAYKMLNILTPHSLKVRMAEIDYIEAGSGKKLYSRTGFFIEDTDDAAKRNGVKEIDVAGISVSQLSPEAAGRFALFQYMIGNLDWSMYSGLEGEDCCHNAKLIGDRAEPLQDLVPVPYDFDYSGFVDTPYAVPPVTINVRTVRTRRYRGFCRHNDEVRSAAAQFIANRDAVYAVLDEIDGLKNSKKNKTIRYLDDFYRTIGDADRLNTQLLDKCRQ